MSFFDSNSFPNKCKNEKNDIFYTPKPVVLKMIEMCNITPDMKVLDPCYGRGVFYENFPECDKHWCEIEKGKDFFAETERYDLIIGNPPFSVWNKWLQHTMRLTDKFCYIIGSINLTLNRLKMFEENGFGITQIKLVEIDYWFGRYDIIMVEKNKPSIYGWMPRVCCDICGKRCLRGTKGNSKNECVPRPEKKKK